MPCLLIYANNILALYHDNCPTCKQLVACWFCDFWLLNTIGCMSFVFDYWFCVLLVDQNNWLHFLSSSHSSLSRPHSLSLPPSQTQEETQQVTLDATLSAAALSGRNNHRTISTFLFLSLVLLLILLSPFHPSPSIHLNLHHHHQNNLLFSNKIIYQFISYEVFDFCLKI
jgi:hypothetical protein